MCATWEEDSEFIWREVGCDRDAEDWVGCWTLFALVLAKMYESGLFGITGNGGLESVLEVVGCVD